MVFLSSRLFQDRHTGAFNMYLMNWTELNVVLPGYCFLIIVCDLIFILGTILLPDPTYLNIKKSLPSPCFTMFGLRFMGSRSPGCSVATQDPWTLSLCTRVILTSSQSISWSGWWWSWGQGLSCLWWGWGTWHSSPCLSRDTGVFV